MITGWRHNDLRKSEPQFREEVQKEFERLYNVDTNSNAFDQAVKDALARLLDPKNPKGFGTDGIDGVGGRSGQGSGRDGSGEDGRGGDGRDGNGRNGGDGRGGNGGTGGGFTEKLLQFNVFGEVEEKQTSEFSTLTEAIGERGSGLTWFIPPNSDGHYAPDHANAIAHALTTEWHQFPEKPLNESRLFTSSYHYADWTDTPNILSTHPAAFDTDGTLKRPYFVSDIGFDAFGHGQKVKISNLKDWFAPTQTPEILEPLRIINTRQTRNALSYGALAWYDAATNELLPDIGDTTNGKYNGTIERYMGHGQTSDWTVGNTGPALNPSLNLYHADHHFYTGDWRKPSILMTRMNPDQLTDYGDPDPDNVGYAVTDIHNDSYGHNQWVETRQFRKQIIGRGLHTTDEANWYTPAKERELEHPEILSGSYLISPFSFAGGVSDGTFVDYFGNPLWRNTGGTIIQTVDGINYVSPRVPTAFWQNDSGHLEAIGWSELPLIRGPKGEKGDAAVVAAYVAATNTLSPGSPATGSVVNMGTSTNANFAFTFGIPAGQNGINGTNGTNGINGNPATVAAIINSVTDAPLSVSVTNIGTTQNAIFAFDFWIPSGGGPPSGPITNNYTYLNNVQNIGSYNAGDIFDLVQNPGTNNPVYIRRITTTAYDSIRIQNFSDSLFLAHNDIFSLWAGDWALTTGLGHTGVAATLEPFDNGDGTWTFPAFEINENGHVINAYEYVVPMGGGGGGDYYWRVGTEDGDSVVNSMNLVRFLSSDTDKLEITQVGNDLTFDVKNEAFDLQPLIFGNGLSQAANSPITPGFEYDPYTGATVHVNNNTAALAGIVKKGTDPSVLEVMTKAWGTNGTNTPDWRPIVKLKGSRYISLIEESPGVYAVTLVN